MTLRKKKEIDYFNEILMNECKIDRLKFMVFFAVVGF